MLGGGGGTPPIVGSPPKISPIVGGGAADCMVLSMLDVAAVLAFMSCVEFALGGMPKDPARLPGLSGGRPPEEGDMKLLFTLDRGLGGDAMKSLLLLAPPGGTNPAPPPEAQS